MVKKVVRAVVPKPNTIDFETMPIRQHPDYPPVPISVSIKYYGKKPKYLAWGHTRGQNNCTKEEAREQIVAAMKGEVLCHNSKFDLAICLRHFGIPIPSWDKIHDTMFLAYLSQPRSWTFGLKPLGKSLLGMDQDEKDAVSDWICANQPIPGRRVTPSKAGEFTAFAPSGVVGPYADGDTIRTEALFNKLYPEIVEAGMLEAYDRERKLVPILILNELSGVPVNLDLLRSDVMMYRKALFDLDIWIKKKLKVSDINLNSAPELGEALVRSGLADPAKLGVNSKGYQTNKEALSLAIKDTQFLNALLYRGRLTTCLGTFMEPWLHVAERTGGYIHTNWNQIKSEGGGTTTGRFSSSPNFQNIPNEFEPLFHPEVGEKGKQLPKPPVFLPPLPYVRKYIVPGKGRILIDRDYSQQELRILGHFEAESLMESYLEDPWMDAHDTAKGKLEEIGLFYERKPVKNTNFGIIYGQSAPSLAVMNNIDIASSKQLINAIKNDIFPGLKDLFSDLKERSKNDEPIRTWGGRVYYCEEPRYNDKLGYWQTFDYKLLNLLIQGSAADCTKEALIRWYDVKHEDDRFLLSVHDQETADTPVKRLHEAMKIMKDTMESLDFDVPMLSEGKAGYNWFDLKDYDKKGVMKWQ